MRLQHIAFFFNKNRVTRVIYSNDRNRTPFGKRFYRRKLRFLGYIDYETPFETATGFR